MADGRPVKQPKSPKRGPVTSLRLDPQLKRLAKSAAAATGLTLTEWLDAAMRAQLRLEGRKLQALQKDQWRQLGLPGKLEPDEG